MFLRNDRETGSMLTSTMMAIGLTGILALAIGSVTGSFSLSMQKSHARSLIEQDGQLALGRIKRDLGQLGPNGGTNLQGCSGNQCTLVLTPDQSGRARQAYYYSFCRPVQQIFQAALPAARYCFACGDNTLPVLRMQVYTLVGASWQVSQQRDFGGDFDQGLGRGISACFFRNGNMLTIDTNMVATNQKEGRLQNYRSQVVLPLVNSSNVSFYK